VSAHDVFLLSSLTDDLIMPQVVGEGKI
jgi:hypothetical protein